MIPEWAPIPGFPNYSVSSVGEVRNDYFDRMSTITVSSQGYLVVKLHRDGVGYQKLVHRLVAEAFMEDFRPKLIIGHLDKNPLNNRIENLYIKGEAIRSRRISPYRPTGRRVRIKENGLVFRSPRTCAEYIGGDYRKVLAVLRGVQHTHRGYSFEWLGTTEALEYARKGLVL